MHVKKGDAVIVITGKEKGKSGVVASVLRLQNKVVVEGLNKMKKHTRPTKAGAKGGIVEISMPLDASNVKLADKKAVAPKPAAKAKKAAKKAE
jgi:large subunit ribosomal protein L24